MKVEKETSQEKPLWSTPRLQRLVDLDQAEHKQEWSHETTTTGAGFIGGQSS